MAILDKRRLPLLNTIMRFSHITNEQAAAVAGVSTRTVSEARRAGGQAIRSDYASFIEEAIYKISKERTTWQMK